MGGMVKCVEHMSRGLWNFLYLVGRSPWDTGVTPPELVELIEEGKIPPGRALDIGCGTGTNAIYLAQHGFQTVGADISCLAIKRARHKARRAGLPVKFYTGDVLRLGMPKRPGIIIPVDFALDIGCLHSLAAAQLQSYAGMLRRVLRIGGFYLLYAWGPRKLQGRFVGLMSEETITALGSYFHNIWTREGEERGAPSYWYLFERLS
jgi:SAM-dependent methyltransferase